jgi:hypothetical protein
MDQIQFLEHVVKENLDTINKYLIRANRGASTAMSSSSSSSTAAALSSSEPTVFAVQTETIHFAAKPDGHLVHRIFVSGPDHPTYRTVGWLLYTDVDYCLICNAAFGFFCYKYYCWSCGNIVCNTCSPHSVLVSEISDLGPKRVCLQCCWGQDVVSAVHMYKDPNALRIDFASTNAQMNLLAKANSQVNASTPASMKSRFHTESSNTGGGSTHNNSERLNSAFGRTDTNNSITNSSGTAANAYSVVQPGNSFNNSNTDRESFSSTTSATPKQSQQQTRTPRVRPSLIISSGVAAGYILVTPTPGILSKNPLAVG